MSKIGNSPAWKSWLKIGRLVPLLTILAALVVGMMSLLGRFEVSKAESVIIALLTLLSIDALVERMSLLEKIDERLGRLPERKLLLDRSQLTRMEDLAAHASEIWITGTTLVSIVHPYYDFYIRKLHDGCNLRFLIIDPNSDAVEVRDKQLSAATVKEDINTSLAALENLLKRKDLKGKCEVKLSSTYLPFSLVIVNGPQKHSLMIVEILTYKTNLHERPHFQLTKQYNHGWFDLFYDQFQRIWNDSHIYRSHSKVIRS